MLSNQGSGVERWRAVVLGVQTTSAEYRMQLLRRRINIDELADEMLDLMVVARERRTIMLAAGSLGELGLVEAVPYEQVCQRIIEAGYILCPAEAGAAIRLAHATQPRPTEMRVAMKPIMTTLGPRIFSIRHLEAGRTLAAQRVPDSLLWPPEIRFFFVVPNGIN